MNKCETCKHWSGCEPRDVAPCVRLHVAVWNDSMALIGEHHCGTAVVPWDFGCTLWEGYDESV